MKGNMFNYLFVVLGGSRKKNKESRISFFNIFFYNNVILIFY